MKNKLTWEGDIEDDCTLKVGQYLAHCECLSVGLVVRDPETKERFKIESWFVGVYRGKETLFHSGEVGGLITSGELARGIAEAIIKAALEK
jgi:hypothetical protein